MDTPLDFLPTLDTLSLSTLFPQVWFHLKNRKISAPNRKFSHPNLFYNPLYVDIAQKSFKKAIEKEFTA